jgi:hypothetical protein
MNSCGISKCCKIGTQIAFVSILEDNNSCNLLENKAIGGLYEESIFQNYGGFGGSNSVGGTCTSRSLEC